MCSAVEDCECEYQYTVIDVEGAVFYYCMMCDELLHIMPN